MENNSQQLQDALHSANKLEEQLKVLSKTLTELNNNQGELGKVFTGFAKRLNDGAASLQKKEEAFKRANHLRWRKFNAVDYV